MHKRSIFLESVDEMECRGSFFLFELELYCFFFILCVEGIRCFKHVTGRLRHEDEHGRCKKHDANLCDGQFLEHE